MEEHRDIEEVELMDYLMVMWKRKTLIVVVTALFLVGAVEFGSIKYPIKHITEIVISLNFPGIEKHRYPDGTLFEPRQIIAPTILSRAGSLLKEKDDNFLTDNLRGAIQIQPVIPPEVEEKIEKAKKAQRSFEFFPNQFSLTLTTEKQMVIPAEERARVLYSIIDEYRKEFNRRYGQEALIAIDFPEDFVYTYDYIDIVAALKTRIDNAVKFLDAKIKTAGLFRSRQTGRSFIDIKDDIVLLKKTRLDKTESTINTLKLTKNKEMLINQYKYRIKKLDIEKQKKEAEALIARNLLQDVGQPLRVSKNQLHGSSRSAETFVIDSSFIEGLIKNNYYQTLVETALRAESEAKGLEIEKSFLEREIVELKEKGREKEKEKEKEQEKVLVAKLKNLQDELTALLEEANRLNEEYLKNIVSGAVQIVKQPQTFKIREGDVGKSALLAGVFGLMLSIFLAFSLEYIEKVRGKKGDSRKA